MSRWRSDRDVGTRQRRLLISLDYLKRINSALFGTPSQKRGLRAGPPLPRAPGTTRGFIGSRLCVPRTPSVLITRPNRLTSAVMIALFCLCLSLFASPIKSKSRLEAENAALRYQLIVLKRRVRGRVQLTNGDRLFLVQLYRWFPSVLKAITIIRPETLLRWHRAGFRRYWRWKSRSLGGRPQIDAELRALIRRMSVASPLLPNLIFSTDNPRR